MLQYLFVGLCLILAVLFMAKKIYRALTGKSKCGCDCEQNCKYKTAGCSLDGNCPSQKNFQELEIKPRNQEESTK